MEKKLYRGRLRWGYNGEEDEVLVIDPGGLKCYTEFLAEELETDLCLYGNLLTVRYFISDEECPIDKLEEEWFKVLTGVGSARYHMEYTEITGYLWTEQDLMVGGHNLMAELMSYVGKWVHMEIEFNRSDKPSIVGGA